MTILIQLAHPAQYYFYRESIKNWICHGNKVIVVIKTKDILEQLLRSDNIPYRNINKRQHRSNKLGLIFDMVLRDMRLLKICLRERVDILTGSTAEVPQIAWLIHKSSVSIGEDDANIIPAYVKSVMPFLQTRLTPDSCKCGPMEDKSVHYSGFQKLAYLHPNIFTPDATVLQKYGIERNDRYFIIRLVSLTAHHDDGIIGLGDEILDKIISCLERKGKVFISSERPLSDKYEPFRLKIDPIDMHHILAFSSIFIGDSQSMAVEAAMLGIPNIRFNDFVGRQNIGVLEELEFKYNLTSGISSSEPDRLLNRISDYLNDEQIHKKWDANRQRMLSDKIDVSAFLTWFIENYPESKRIMKENSEYQYRFK